MASLELLDRNGNVLATFTGTDSSPKPISNVDSVRVVGVWAIHGTSGFGDAAEIAVDGGNGTPGGGATAKRTVGSVRLLAATTTVVAGRIQISTPCLWLFEGAGYSGAGHAFTARAPLSRGTSMASYYDFNGDWTAYENTDYTGSSKTVNPGKGGFDGTVGSVDLIRATPKTDIVIGG